MGFQTTGHATRHDGRLGLFAEDAPIATVSLVEGVPGAQEQL